MTELIGDVTPIIFDKTTLTKTVEAEWRIGHKEERTISDFAVNKTCKVRMEASGNCRCAPVFLRLTLIIITLRDMYSVIFAKCGDELGFAPVTAVTEKSDRFGPRPCAPTRCTDFNLIIFPLFAQSRQKLTERTRFVTCIQR